ncbi:MAG: hypothetical protein ABIV50_05190 [Opitutus sp.]
MATVVPLSGATHPAGPIQLDLRDGGRPRFAHRELRRSLQRAYSAERAASFAHVGHAGSLRDPVAKAAIKQIEEGHLYCRKQGRVDESRADDPRDVALYSK